MAIRSLKSGTFSRSGLVGNPVIMPGSYESIATTTVGSGGQSTISFTSIPGTYSHLQLRAVSRRTSSGSLSRLTLQANSTGTYTQHELNGNGTAASSLDQNGTGSIYLGGNPGTTINSSTFGTFVVDILDYANTNKYKTFRSLNGCDFNGDGVIYFQSASFPSTSAITSLTLTDLNGGNIAQYSSFALYGVN